MRRPRRRHASCALAAVVLGLALVACGGDGAPDGGGDGAPPAAGPPPAPPAPAAPPAAAPYPTADLAISIEHPDQEPVAYTVTCDSASASASPADVVDANTACAALARPDAVARLVDGAPADRVCTEIYGGPDVARITGTIDGASVDTTVDRANGCGIADWDGVLVGLLPRAVGVTS